MAEKLRRMSLRDLFAVVLPTLIIVGLAFWATAQFIKPAPPGILTISTGSEIGAYHKFAMRYRDIFARHGVELAVMPSTGSLENIARLRNPEVDDDAAFVQSSTVRIQEDDDLLTLGAFYYEPLWIFYRDGVQAKTGKGAQPQALESLTTLLQLKRLRIAIGGDGSGTQNLALELLAANGIDTTTTTLVPEGGMHLVEQLTNGSVDAVFVVGPPESALVWTLLHTAGVKLMSVAHAEAYSRRFSGLSHLTLPRGAIDLVRDVPPADVQLVAPMSTMVVRGDTHPALIDLLMQAATEVHGEPGIFQRSAEFPRAMHSEFPTSPEATRYYASGKPFLQRYLPFWAAVLVDRLVVFLLPIIAILFPLIRLAPTLYAWRVRSRIYRQYGELKFIEAELQETPQRHSREAWLLKLDAIESEANRMPTPLAFADMLYTLREHIGLVRATVLRGRSEPTVP